MKSKLSNQLNWRVSALSLPIEILLSAKNHASHLNTVGIFYGDDDCGPLLPILLSPIKPVNSLLFIHIKREKKTSRSAEKKTLIVR